MWLPPLVAKLGFAPAAMLALQDNVAACFFLRQNQHISVHTWSSCVGSGACEDRTIGMKSFEASFCCCTVFQLGRIEAELRESLRLDEERQREAEFLRQQENKTLRTDLFYLSLSQRVAKWDFTYLSVQTCGRAASSLSGAATLQVSVCLTHSNLLHRPWVSSYFRKFPMHMYCLPVQAANHRARRRGLSKKKWLPTGKSYMSYLNRQNKCGFNVIFASSVHEDQGCHRLAGLFT